MCVWVRDSHTLDLHCVAMYMLDGENFSFYFGKIARRIRSHTHTQTLTHSHSHRAQFLSAISNSIKTENCFYLSVPLSLCKQQNFLDFRFGVCVWIKFTESRIATQKSLLLNLTFPFFLSRFWRSSFFFFQFGSLETFARSSVIAGWMAGECLCVRLLVRESSVHICMSMSLSHTSIQSRTVRKKSSICTKSENSNWMGEGTIGM